MSHEASIMWQGITLRERKGAVNVLRCRSHPFGHLPWKEYLPLTDFVGTERKIKCQLGG